MYFRSWSKRLFIFLCLLTLTGSISCAPRIGEDPPPQSKLALTGASCLDTASENFVSFFKGEGEKEKINQAWGCVASTFFEFKKYIRGRESDRYSPSEIAKFIEDNFLHNAGSSKKISVGLQQQLMKIKVILVGGSEDYLLHNEIQLCISMIDQLSQMSLELNPHMKILTMHWTPQIQMANDQLEDFENANLAFQNFIQKFSDLVSRNNPSYSLENISRVLRELEIYQRANWDWIEKVEQFLPFVKKLKKSVAGGEEALVAPSEWKIFLLLGGRTYIQFLRFHYFISRTQESSAFFLAYVARCFEDIFSIFQDLVALKTSGSVTRTEINEIFHALTLAWPKIKSSPELTFEFMKIKKLILGGSVEAFTVRDFTTAKLKVFKVKDLVARFIPFYSVYGLTWKPNLDDPETSLGRFSEAKIRLMQLLKEIGILLESSYSYQDLINLFTEIEKLYPPKNPNESIVVSLKKYVCVSMDLKQILFKEFGDQRCRTDLNRTNWAIQKEQWPNFLEHAGNLYSSFLHYFYFVKDNGLTSRTENFYLDDFVKQSVQTIGKIYTTAKKEFFSEKELKALVYDVKEAGFLPEKLSKKSLDTLVELTLSHFLNPTIDRISGVVPAGLTTRLLNNFLYEFQVWHDPEVYLQYLMQDKSLSKAELLNQIKIGIEQNPERRALQEGLRELGLMVDSPYTLVVNEKNRILIDYSKNHAIDTKTLRSLNMYRYGARFLSRSFGENLKSLERYQGLTQCELDKAYSMVQQLFVDLGYIDAKSTSFISARFIEANIFVPRADGNSYASFEEMSEITAMIVSGFSLGSIFQSDLRNSCSISDKGFVGFKCLRNSYYASSPKVDSLSEYQKYFTRTDREVWNETFANNLKSVGGVPNDQQMVLLSEVSFYPHALQYTEMLFAKFDKNQDGILSKEDLIRAFPTFEGLFLNLAKKQISDGVIKKSELGALFTFIVKYGKVPSCDKTPSFLCLLDKEIRDWLDWKENYKDDDHIVYADRLQVSRVLSLIADEISRSKTQTKVQVTRENTPLCPRPATSVVTENVPDLN